MLGVENLVMRWILVFCANDWGRLIHDGALSVGIDARSHEAERCVGMVFPSMILLSVAVLQELQWPT
jgi:hypothetical protein